MSKNRNDNLNNSRNCSHENGGYGDYDTMGAAFASGLRRYSGAGANMNEYQVDIACNPIFGGGSSVMVYTYDNNRDAPENVNLLNVVVFA
jgi:hypothetical protein